MTWVVMLAIGLGSLLFRLGPLLLLPRTPLSPSADRLVRHAGLAAIAALVALSSRQVATGSAPLPAVAALAAGVVLAARGASVLRLLLAGGGVYGATAVVVAVVGG